MNIFRRKKKREFKTAKQAKEGGNKFFGKY